VADDVAQQIRAGFKQVNMAGVLALCSHPNCAVGWVSPMFRIIALTAMVAGPSITAQAADTTLTLACQGTETSQWGSRPKSSEKVNIGIIVDLQKKTVTGLSDSYPLTIESITDTMITFSGQEGGWDKKSSLAWSMYGTLDRITGSLVASSSRYEAPKNELSYDLKCKPAQRMF
jgi:hypothetical protein